MGLDLNYNHAVIAVTLPGFLAAIGFTLMYGFLDRPRFRDRYAGILFGLGIIAILGFFVPLLIAIFSPEVYGREVTGWRWAISIVLRGLGSAFMCYLFWVYLTPQKARNRLGRFSPTREAPHDPDTS